MRKALLVGERVMIGFSCAVTALTLSVAIGEPLVAWGMASWRRRHAG